jgi:hypothetical protein
MAQAATGALAFRQTQKPDWIQHLSRDRIKHRLFAIIKRIIFFELQKGDGVYETDI